MKVPFVDLKEQYGSIKEEINNSIINVLESCQFILGPETSSFEEEFARYCGVDYCVGVSSGTDALKYSLISLGISSGDEVITVSNTFIATAEAISQTGARPVFVDIDEKTYNMDIKMLRGAITNKSKAIIPVHLYGQCSDMDDILDVAREYQLKVVEDACQAHGAEYKGKRAGSLGHAAAFSFYPGKNLGSYGEAGAVTTNDIKLYNKVRMIRDHGQSSKYHHLMEGYNGRLDSIQAAVLRVKLKYIDKWNEERRGIAQLYNEELAKVGGLITQHNPEFCRHVYHLYVIRVKHRDKLREFLSENGIDTGIHYPIPIHLQKAYDFLGIKTGSLHVTEKVSNEILSLPIYPEMNKEMIYYVITKIKEFFA